MKLYFSILVLSLLIACSKANEEFKSLPEFEYPIDSLVKEKIFVFKNDQTNELIFENHRIYEEKGSRYYSVKSSDSLRINSERKYLITETGLRFISYFSFEYDDSLSEEINKIECFYKDVKNVMNSSRFRDLSYKFIFNTGGMADGLSINEERFIRKDSILFLNKTIETLVYSLNTKTIIKLKFLPFIPISNEYNEEIIYGKNLGVIRYSVTTEEAKQFWNLIEIRE
jgi:hypothetical protein